jgi:hypothetical protein
VTVNCCQLMLQPKPNRSGRVVIIMVSLLRLIEEKGLV